MNALDVETLTSLRDRLAELSRNVDARVVVLTGAGDRAFIAGADIKYMSGLDVGHAKAWGALGHEAGRLLETMRQPTIAAVNGFALGGGCELATKSPLALEAAKEAVNGALSGDHGANLANEGDRFGELFSSEDAREGLTAFAEKREPKFTGR